MVDFARLGPYGEAPGSVMASLNKMNRRDRIRYWFNVRRHKEDQQSLEQWANSGFMSFQQVSYDEEEEVLDGR